MIKSKYQIKISSALSKIWFQDFIIILIISLLSRILVFNHLHDFSPDEIYYTLLSQEYYISGSWNILTLFNTSYRLLLSYIISTVFHITRNPSIYIARAFSSLINSLIAPFTYIFGRIFLRNQNARMVSITSSLLIIFNFGIWNLSDRVWVDSTLTVLIISLLIILYYIDQKNNQIKNIYFPSICAIMLFLAIIFTKMESVFLLLPIILFFTYKNKSAIYDLFKNNVRITVLITTILVIVFIVNYSTIIYYTQYLLYQCNWHFSHLIDINNPYHKNSISALWRWLTVFLVEPDIFGIIIILSIFGLTCYSRYEFLSIGIFILNWFLWYSLIVSQYNFSNPTSGISGIRHLMPVIPLLYISAVNFLLSKPNKRKTIISVLIIIIVYLWLSLFSPFFYYKWSFDITSIIIISIYTLTNLIRPHFSGSIIFTYDRHKRVIKTKTILKYIPLLLLLLSQVLINVDMIKQTYVSTPYWHVWYEAENDLSSLLSNNDRLLALMPDRWRLFSQQGYFIAENDVKWENRSLIPPSGVVIPSLEFYPLYMLSQEFLMKNNISHVGVTRKLFRSIDKGGETDWEELANKKYLTHIYGANSGDETVLALYKFQPGHWVQNVTLVKDEMNNTEIFNDLWDIQEGQFIIREDYLASLNLGWNLLTLKINELNIDMSVISCEFIIGNASEFRIILSDNDVKSEGIIRLHRNGFLSLELVNNNYRTVIKKITNLNLDLKNHYFLNIFLDDNNKLFISLLDNNQNEIASISTILEHDKKQVSVGVYGEGKIYSFTIIKIYWENKDYP